MSKRNWTVDELVAYESFVVKLWEEGEIRCPVHFSGGNESQLIEIFKGIKEGDYVFSGHRNHYHYLLHGGDPDRLTSEILGQVGGICGGHGRSMGVMDHGRRFYASAIVGGLVAPAVGVAWGLKREGSKARVWCFVGDGAVDGGHFWESLQYAEGWNLPITFVVEDNNRSTCSTISDRYSERGDHVRDWWFERLNPFDKLQRYFYTPTYPHVGTGKYVQF